MRDNVKKKLGNILLEAGKIDNIQLQKALDFQVGSKRKLGEALVELNILTEEEIIQTLSHQLSIDRVFLDKVFVDPEIARSIPKEVAKKYCLIPINEKDGSLTVVMNDPLNVFAIDDVSFITHKRIIPGIADRTSIEKAIDIYYNKQTTDKALEDLKKEYNVQIDGKENQSDDDVQNAPAVRLANSIISQAVSIRASDIHIEPFEKNVIVRYRVNGVLSESTRFPINIYSAVSTRIKIMAGINIAERRIPQDGRIEMEVNNKAYDFRVSTLPTVFGEKIVIRILDRSGFLVSRSNLGLSEHENALFDKILQAPYGIVLVTGPTGSGKSTTLYAMLKELNTPDKNIITIEDPVEYMMFGINQVQVNAKAGLTFAAGLRSVLRQDPDIIMLGEIRDEETAQIAVRASITGHLVLSTLHTNDAPGSISRLVDMGIESYLAAEAVIAVIAQRLIRVLCQNCKEPYEAKDWELQLLCKEAPLTLYKEKGCPLCNNTGFKGRAAIHEILYIDKELRSCIETDKNTERLREIAVANGMVTLLESCRMLVSKGDSTTGEMVKTVYARD